MKKILLLIVIALITYSSSFAIGGFKVAINKPGAAILVQVRIINYSPGGPTTVFTGDTITLTPNASGIIVADVPATPGILATDVNSFYVVNVYTGNSLTLVSQQRLDGMLFEQAQTGLTDNDGNLTIEPGKELKFPEPAGSGTNFTSFKSPTLAADVVYTLPINDGDANQYLKTDGSGIMSWDTPPTSPTGAAGGDLTGTYPNPTIANDAITTAMILDGQVQNADLAANAITTSKVANGTVTTSKMADSAISGLKLLTFAVTNRHLATNSLTPDKFDLTGLSSGNVLTYNGSNVVWATPSASPTGAAGGDLTGTYPNPTIANDAITTAMILDGQVQNADLAANAITTSKVANGTVTTHKMADSAISGLKLLTFAVTNRHLANGSVSTSKIDPTGASTNNVLTYNGSSVVWALPGSTLSYIQHDYAGGNTAKVDLANDARVINLTNANAAVTNETLGSLPNGSVVTIRNNSGFDFTFTDATSGTLINGNVRTWYRIGGIWTVSN